jgi:drug/metabolite transporter (DMT)-like permease
LGNHDGNFRTGVEAAITLMLMALVPVCIKLTSATPVTIGIFRLSVATLLMLLFLRPKSLNGLFKPNILLPLFFIGFLFALHWITYFLSIKKATASIGILGASTYGIHLIFLGWAIRNHKPGIFDFVALLLALAGTYFIIPEFSMSNNTTMGILLGVLSGFCFALLPVLHQQYAHIPERVRILGQFLFALLSFSFFFPLAEWQLQPVDWWALLYLAIAGTFIAHSLWVRVTTKVSTVVSSLIFYLIVPMTMVISHFWLKEPMPISKILGAVLIISGNVISLGGRFKRQSKMIGFYKK